MKSFWSYGFYPSYGPSEIGENCYDHSRRDADRLYRRCRLLVRNLNQFCVGTGLRGPKVLTDLRSFRYLIPRISYPVCYTSALEPSVLEPERRETLYILLKQVPIRIVPIGETYLIVGPIANNFTCRRKTGFDNLDPETPVFVEERRIMVAEMRFVE